jgi:hypothetical protein
VSGIGVLVLVREAQIPLLAMLLIGGCAAKAGRVISARSVDAGTGPTVLFPLRLRRTAVIAMCVSELALGAGLLLTAGGLGGDELASAIRGATALLFGTAVGALHELRTRRPDTGCGCFGDLSETPVTWRTMTRAALLCAAALSSIGVTPLRMPDSPGQAAGFLVVIAVELAALAALSPELGQLMVRLGHAEPCEVRRVPVARTLAVLRASAPYRRCSPYLLSETPADVWREGCWRFLAFPGVLANREVDVVFAVFLMGRRVPVRFGVLEADTGNTRPEDTPLQLSNHL